MQRGCEKRRRRASERTWRREHAASALQRRAAGHSAALWARVRRLLRERLLLPGPGPGLEEDLRQRALKRFLISAEAAEVDASTLSAGGQALACAYMCDKFEDRSDTMAAACVQAWEEGLQATGSALQMLLLRRQERPPRVLRVACVGGGPGADAAGFALFNAEALQAPHLQVDTFDLGEMWRPYCLTAMDATAADCSERRNLNVQARFAPADFHQDLSAVANAGLQGRRYDVFIFGYCLHESQAFRDEEHPLLRQLLAAAPRGAIAIALEAWLEPLGEVDAMLRRQGWAVRSIGSGDDGALSFQEHSEDATTFELLRLGGSRDFPFHGLLLHKVK